MHSGSGDPGQGSPDWSDPTQAAGGYPPTVDPAYAAPYTGQYPAAPTGQYWGQGYYGSGYGAPMTQPTEQLPSYWQPGSGYLPGQPPPPPPPPKSPRWLWVAASAAALLVAGLVVALVVVSNSSRNSTVVAPASPPTSTPPPPPIGLPDRATTPALPFPIPLPTATVPVDPTTEAPVDPVPADPQTPEAVGTQTVVYTVTGEGRAINITYVDSGGVMQTEFNVALPWNKQVSLSAPAKDSASVAVVNVGRDVTCSVTVDGTQVRQRTGRGLTICSGIA